MSLQTPEPAKSSSSSLSKLVALTTVILIAVAIYVAWIFYSRHERTRAAQEAIETKKKEANQRTLDLVYGSGEIKFSTFGADTGVLKAGEKTELCYGVLNATSVKLDPHVEDIKPSYHHCIEIAPKTTTKYTITASDAKGNSKSESVTVQVR